MPLVHLATRLVRKTLDIALVGLILVVLATIVIARVIPMLTGGQTFVVGGGSMVPAIPLGAAVMPVPVAAEDLAVGDIVTLQVGEEKAVFTHRIIRITDIKGEVWIHTKGDANADPDPSIIPASAVIGRVDVILPYVGYAIHLLSTSQGVLFLLALGIMVLAGAWLLESLEFDQELARARKALRSIGPDAPTGEGAPG